MSRIIKKPVFRVKDTDQGKLYTFICPESGKIVYITPPIGEADVIVADAIAWEQARNSFNCCQNCGRWISDEAYSIDEMLCVRCSGKRNIIHSFFHTLP